MTKAVPTDPDEFDENQLPGNPFLMETFLDFVNRQKGLILTQRAGAYITAKASGRAECHQCGGCCTYNYYKMRVSDALVKDLKKLNPDPHGYWILGNHALHVFLVYFNGDADEPIRTMKFTGPIGDDYYEFHKATERRHGYWVLNKDNWICCYSPTKCQHLGYTADNRATCDIYATRPKICRNYYCGRYLVNPDDKK